MTRAGILTVALAALLATGCAGRLATAGRGGQPFNVVETGIPELQKALADVPFVCPGPAALTE